MRPQWPATHPAWPCQILNQRRWEVGSLKAFNFAPLPYDCRITGFNVWQLSRKYHLLVQPDTYLLLICIIISSALPYLSHYAWTPCCPSFDLDSKSVDGDISSVTWQGVKFSLLVKFFISQIGSQKLHEFAGLCTNLLLMDDWEYDWYAENRLLLTGVQYSKTSSLHAYRQFVSLLCDPVGCLLFQCASCLVCPSVSSRASKGHLSF